MVSIHYKPTLKFEAGTAFVPLTAVSQEDRRRLLLQTFPVPSPFKYEFMHYRFAHIITKKNSNFHIKAFIFPIPAYFCVYNMSESAEFEAVELGISTQLFLQFHTQQGY